MGHNEKTAEKGAEALYGHMAGSICMWERWDLRRTLFKVKIA